MCTILCPSLQISIVTNPLMEKICYCLLKYESQTYLLYGLLFNWHFINWLTAHFVNISIIIYIIDVSEIQIIQNIDIIFMY